MSASVPRITSSNADGCVSASERVQLNCEVRYNGTNLMPMKMRWTRWIPSNWCKYTYRSSIVRTVNASNLHRTSYTFQANDESTRIYDCSVIFSYPTGLVVAGVERQYRNWPRTFWSSPHASRTVAGLLIAVFMLTIQSYCILTLSLSLSLGWLRGSVVERRSSAGVLSLSCARPVADG